MKIVEIIKNYEDGFNTLLIGQKYEVTGWKADELIQKKVAKMHYRKIENSLDIEKR